MEYITIRDDVINATELIIPKIVSSDNALKQTRKVIKVKGKPNFLFAVKRKDYLCNLFFKKPFFKVNFRCDDVL